MSAAAMTGEPDTAAASPLWRAVLPIWLAVGGFLMLIYAPAVYFRRFPDPDDLLRLLQVRDWLAGQAWFDLNNYRIGPPDGVPMHWSRLVDIPIALVELPLLPLIGRDGAETVALALVPVLTLGVAMVLIARIAESLFDRPTALLAAAVTAIAPSTAHQLRPTRIDHHGWQIVAALVMLLGMLDANRRRGGVVSGLALATWLTISMEGVPMAAACLALFAVRWLFDEAERERLVACAISLAAGSAALWLVTRSGAGWVDWCDQLSPIHLAMLATGAAGVTLVARFAPARLPVRLACLAGVGLAAIAPMPLYVPRCLGGTFADLDPVVASFWLERVGEGLPFWEQNVLTNIATAGLPLLALYSLRRRLSEEAGGRRPELLVLGFAVLASLAVALLVERAAAVAAVFALPAAAWQVRRWLLAARKIAPVGKRIAATAAALTALTPSLPVAAAVEALAPAAKAAKLVKVPKKLTKAEKKCGDQGRLGVLNGLPPGLALAPIDFGPAVILASHHTILGSGHHRGQRGMKAIITTFRAPPEAAHREIRRLGVDYIVYCPNPYEPSVYRMVSPNGLMAELHRNRLPDWLEQVRFARNPALRVYRVKG